MIKTPPIHRSIRRHILVGIAICVTLVGGVGGWAASVDIAGAIIAPGVLVVESNVKNVQHPQGGVVGEIKVKDGDFVRTGDVVVRLDDTQIRASLGIITNALDEISARTARLTAEQNGYDNVVFSDDLNDRDDAADIIAVLSGEQRLFELRREARHGQKAQLKERALQFREEIKGLEGQAKAKVREIALIEEELAALSELLEKELVSATRVKALEREEARLDGERGQLVAAIAQANGRIAEMELQIIQIDQDMRSEVAREIAELRTKSSELGERKIAVEDELGRIDIRAPRDGIVHQLAVHTVGGVVGSGESVMLIIPNDDLLIVETRVNPSDIDQLHIGQEAVLRLSAFNQRTTPEIVGAVQRISADLTEDTRTGTRYFTVHMSIPDDKRSQLGSIKLVPGMPVEAFIQTASRTALSYLTKPLIDQGARAFLEE